MDRTACGKYRIEELPRTDSAIEIEVSEFVLKLCIHPPVVSSSVTQLMSHKMHQMCITGWQIQNPQLLED